MTMIVQGVQSAGIALTVMAKSVMAIYGVATEFDRFLSGHLEKMSGSDNPTIARTGRVIQGAKYGFGIGYIVPVAIIAVGQFILGNSLSAVATVASAAALSNPVAMTCAAVGAIYYGWAALSAREQAEMLERVSAGLELGVELLKSVISFVVAKVKELLSSDNMKEMKRFIADAAGRFGKTLGDVTGALKDRVVGAVEMVTRTAAGAGQVVLTTAAGAGHTVLTTAAEAGQTVLATVRQSLPGKVPVKELPPLSELTQFENGLRRLIGDPTELRPFVCDGSPLKCDVFIVGLNPASAMSNDFWSFWRPGLGFDKGAWLDAYRANRAAQPLAPGKTRRQTISSSRRTIEWIVSEIGPARCLETNIYASATEDYGRLSEAQRNTAPFDFLIQSIAPSVIIVHGKDSEAHVLRIATKCSIIPVSHFSRGWSEVKARELGRRVADKLRT